MRRYIQHDIPCSCNCAQSFIFVARRFTIRARLALGVNHFVKLIAPASEVYAEKVVYPCHNTNMHKENIRRSVLTNNHSHAGAMLNGTTKLVAFFPCHLKPFSVSTPK